MIRAEIVKRNADELMEICGMTANIERYAINDGNGVRTTVFTKGCYLRNAVLLAGNEFFP